MTLFSTITKGMADGAETLQANFAKLATAITSIGDDGTMTVPKLNVTNLAVSGDVPWTTLTLSSGGTGGLKYTKKNGLVELYVYFSPSAASTSLVTIGTLPAGVRPTDDTRVSGMNGGSLNTSALATITSDGVVKIGGNPSLYTGTMVRIHTTFYAE